MIESLRVSPLSSALTVTDPLWVYLIAFDIRFIMICFVRIPSMQIWSGKSSLTNPSNWRPFCSALNLRMSTHSSISYVIPTICCMLRIIFLCSCWEKSRISFTRNNMSLLQFMATVRYLKAASTEMNGTRSCRDRIKELSGFLNSCAADAKATVLRDWSYFCFSSSSQCDMSLTVVITKRVSPIFTFCLNTWSFLS